jgi:hypothetical protein
MNWLGHITALSTLILSFMLPSRMEYCATIAGGCVDNYGYAWSLLQHEGGSVDGEVDTINCGTYQITGSYASDSLDLYAFRQDPYYGCVSWFEYWGQLEAPGCNYGNGSWVNESRLRGRWTWTRNCDIPSGEHTYYTEWMGTFLGFYQQLLPDTFPFDGRRVSEIDAGNGGPDTCYFPGSLVSEQIRISNPGEWLVYNDNAWGPDYVGWDQAPIEYCQFVRPMLGYPMPCGTTLRQQMRIACHEGYQAYRLNILKAVIGLFNVYNERDGIGGSTIYPE